MNSQNYISRMLIEPVADETLLSEIFNHLFLDKRWLQLANYKTIWMTSGQCCCPYKYGGQEVPHTPMTPIMSLLTQCVCKLTGISSINSVNINYYSHNFCYVGWHRDDEELFLATKEPTVIVSLSLGHARDFEMKDSHTGNTEKVTLHNGQLITMEGLFQKFCVHRVPSSYEHAGPRINLTWRTIKKHTEKCPLSGS